MNKRLQTNAFIEVAIIVRVYGFYVNRSTGAFGIASIFYMPGNIHGCLFEPKLNFVITSISN